MGKPLFVIKDLVCAYKRGYDVLRIPYLEIPQKKFTVLIGKSGSGKSTFLETLGLMNNTVKSGDVLFFPKDDKEPISIKSLWAKDKKALLAKIRRDHFSFIFQDTNLMPNFTAYENACLSQMIQGVPMGVAMEKVKSIMNTINLGDVEEWKNAVELSGGQKQRLAFVRAVTPDFSVLFGDEPTGNLDEYNSDDLMASLKSNIQKNGTSTIIVSHNVPLSVKYADVIILLTKKDDTSNCVEIDSHHIYQRMNNTTTWIDSAQEDVPLIIENIQTALKTDRKT